MTDASESRAAKGGPGGLGERVRQVRTARGMSVRELARRAGCSASLVSQVERGVTAPSAGVVCTLANQLGISLDFLFGTDDIEPAELPRLPGHNSAPADHRNRVGGGPTYAEVRPWGRVTGADGAGIVQRADDRNTIELSTGVRWERLTPTHDSRVDFIETVYEPGGQSSETGRAVRHDGREYQYVLQGELEAVVGFETLRLVEGDSLAFDPATPHHYRNPTTQTARVLSIVVHDPPDARFTR
jgi:transcriptional regulator with XRE-family HTH domain